MRLHLLLYKLDLTLPWIHLSFTIVGKIWNVSLVLVLFLNTITVFYWICTPVCLSTIDLQLLSEVVHHIFHSRQNSVWMLKHYFYMLSNCLSNSKPCWRNTTLKILNWGLPCWSKGLGSVLPLQGVQVWSLVRELGSCMPHGVAKNTKQNKKTQK